MQNKLICLLGKSGSGKTTVANALHDTFGLSVLPSYTTRPKRKDSGNDHEYVTEEEFNSLKDIVAFNTYSGFLYGATKEQCETYDIYVVDAKGLECLHKYGIPCVSFFIDCNDDLRIDRMVERGDSEELIAHRIETDNKEYAEDLLSKVDYRLDSTYISAMNIAKTIMTLSSASK